MALTKAQLIDLNGNELILDLDADTSITADTDDQIDIKIAGADDFRFTANTFTALSGSTIAAQALTATSITSTGNIVIPNAGTIGSASDADSIAISSAGVVTFSQSPVFPDGSLAVVDLDIDGATDIGAAIVDADLFIVDDGAGGTNRKVTASRIKTYAGFDGAITTLDIDGGTDIGAGLADADLFIVDDGAGGTNRKTAASRIKTYIADVTLTTAAQTNITSLGTLTALTVDDVAVDGKVVTMTGSSGDTFVTTVAANGATSLVTTDASAAAANLTITADGTVGINSTGDMTLDSSADIIFDADGGDFSFKDGGTEILKISNSSSDVIIKPIVDAKDIIFQQRDGTEVARIEDNATFNVVTSKLAINGTAITSTAAELNLLDGVSGLVQADLTKLAAIDATAAEINLIDGGTSTGTTAVADADGIITNDGGTMRLTTAATFKTYFQEGISTAYDDLTAGDAAVTITTSSGNIVIDAAANDTDIILKGSDGGADTTYLTIDGSDAGKATFNAGVVATTVVGSGAAQFATMGIGSAKDLGVGLHIKTADAGGGTPGAGRDNLIIEDSGSTGITIIGGTSSDIGIAMGDSDDVNTGMINYNNANNIMTFQAGGNANILGITSSTVVINEDSDDVDFRVESNGNANMLVVNGGGDRVGIGGDPDLGVGIHIRTSDTGGDAEIHADELVLENDNNCGITILAGNDDASIINFGDDGDNNIGMISYTHDGNFLRFKTNTVNEVHIGKGTAGAVATGGELAPDVSAGGLCLQQGSADTNVLAFKSSDVAHGVTDQAETDTWCTFRKMDGPRGGLRIDSFLESNTAENSMQFHAHYSGTNQSTERANGSTGLISLRAYKSDGSTDRTGLATNGNVLTVHNAATCMMIVDADGDILANNSNGTFDEYEDANLVRAVDLSHGRGVIDSKFDKFVKYNSKQLMDLDLIGKDKDGSPNNFVNVTKLQRLHNGAIWQQYEKHNQLLDAVYELAKEAVGEKKANAILEKHEVKRLH